jgi:hypothetical protein
MFFSCRVGATLFAALTALTLSAAPVFALDSQESAAAAGDLPALLREAERLAGEGKYPAARAEYENGAEAWCKLLLVGSGYSWGQSCDHVLSHG